MVLLISTPEGKVLIDRCLDFLNFFKKYVENLLINEILDRRFGLTQRFRQRRIALRFNADVSRGMLPCCCLCLAMRIDRRCRGISRSRYLHWRRLTWRDRQQRTTAHGQHSLHVIAQLRYRRLGDLDHLHIRVSGTFE